MFVKVVQPCKVTWRSSREYLWEGLLIESRNIIGIEKEITILIFLFTCACAFCPLMLFRGMVHNEVKADIDTVFVAFGSQL